MATTTVDRNGKCEITKLEKEITTISGLLSFYSRYVEDFAQVKLIANNNYLSEPLRLRNTLGAPVCVVCSVNFHLTKPIVLFMKLKVTKTHIGLI